MIFAARPDIGAQEHAILGRAQHHHLRTIALAIGLGTVALGQLFDQDIAQKVAVVAQPAQPACGMAQALLVRGIEPGALDRLGAFGERADGAVIKVDQAGHRAFSARAG